MPSRCRLLRPLKCGKRLAHIAKVSYAGFGGTTKPVIIDDGRGSCRGLDWRSVGSEEGLLFFPGEGETNFVREALRGQLDWMTVAQDGLDDIRRQEAEPQDPGEVGPADTDFGGKVHHRLSVITHYHGIVLVGLDKNPVQAVVRLAAGIAARAVYEKPDLHAGTLEPGRNRQGDARIVAFVR